jgi:hypothetical protein
MTPTYRVQKREALARWELRLLSIVEPQATPPNVVELKRRRA